MQHSRILFTIIFLLVFLQSSAQFNPDYMKTVIGFTTYIQTNNMDSLQAMLDDGYSPNFQDKNKQGNPLLYAISADRPQAIQLLIENGADWNYYNTENQSARTLLQINYPDLYKKLNAIRIRSKQFLLSIEEGNFRETEELFANENVNINFKWKNQSNALHFLLKYNLDAENSPHSFDKFQLFKALIDRNIHADVFNAKKEYPLFLAVEHYPAKYTKLLLESDSTLPYEDLPRFAYHVALATDTISIKTALNYIHALDMLTSNGKTMVYNALKQSKLANANYLLLKGASMEKQNEEGQTILNEIVASKDSLFDKIAAVELLLEHDPNINAPDKNAITPLIHSVYDRNYALAKILIESGADVNYSGKGVMVVENALHAAVSRADIEMVELLMNAGANNEIHDELNKTPYQAAKDAFDYYKEQDQKEKAKTFKKIMRLVK